jgi:hypothetical protein
MKHRADMDAAEINKQKEIKEMEKKDGAEIEEQVIKTQEQMRTSKKE